MNDDQQATNPSSSQNQPEVLTRHDSRRQRIEQRRAERGRYGGTWIVGAVLIVLGIAFLLQDLGAIPLNNWWALFIMIPAIGAFGAAWRTYQSAGGRLTAAARGSLIAGFILTMVTVAFLFELNWGVLGPILIILAGLGLLLNAILPG